MKHESKLTVALFLIILPISYVKQITLNQSTGYAEKEHKSNNPCMYMQI